MARQAHGLEGGLSGGLIEQLGKGPGVGGEQFGLRPGEMDCVVGAQLVETFEGRAGHFRLAEIDEGEGLSALMDNQHHGEIRDAAIRHRALGAGDTAIGERGGGQGGAPIGRALRIGESADRLATCDAGQPCGAVCLVAKTR